MKQNEIRIGEAYTAKVSDRLTEVRIDSKHSSGKGWNATNLATQKRIHVKSAQRLRTRTTSADNVETTTTTAAPKAHKSPKAQPVVKVASVAKVGAPNATGAQRGDDAVKGDAKPRPAAKSQGHPKPKRVSAIDAAAQVLQKAGTAMNTKEMIVAMQDQGLWTSPAGKTPHGTLYSAILREITTKGTDARFRKVARGQFELGAAK